jgi:CubicO group peptidase (beta-lactamase class C family)
MTSTPPHSLPKTLALMEQGIRDGLHLGAQLYVSLRGALVADFALGQARAGVAMRPDSLALWLSSVKPVTAVAIARLWEQGRLRLDEPVARFVPEFGRHGKQGITVRHLLTHRGGFRPADRLPEDLSWADTLARICDTPLEPGWTPGHTTGYHLSSSWFVLGEIVRRVDGRPFERYAREELHEPLGMKDTWIGMPPEVFRRYGNRIAWMHVTESGTLKSHPSWNTEAGCAACRPGSNGRGPIRELGWFYEGLLAVLEDRPVAGGAEKSAHAASRPRLRAGGGHFLRPETVQNLIARHRTSAPDRTFNHALDWGLGFLLNSSPHSRLHLPYAYGRHASPRAFGHSGAQSSTGFADPAHGLVVAWAFNGMPAERLHQRRARDVNSAIYEDLGLVAYH